MSYTPALGHVSNQSGSRIAWTGVREDDSLDHRVSRWDIWSEIFHTQAVIDFPQSTGSCVVSVVFEAMPAVVTHAGTPTKDLLGTIELAFGRSATNLANVLRVSRQMIYNYRAGMEAASENKQRLQSLAEFVTGWISQVDRSFEVELKELQPEGRSLLDFLSDRELDFVALRRVIHRRIESRQRDRVVRHALVQELTRDETPEERKDVIRDRHESGKPVYVGDPDNPSKLIQMLPDGRRIRGQMVERQFLPDEK